jgi:hypothetical protein
MAKDTRYAFTVEATQTACGKDWAEYKLTVARANGMFWGGVDVISIHDHNGHVCWWAAPGLSEWVWQNNQYELYDWATGWQALYWKFWNPEPGYLAASSHTITRRVNNISRGNKRQGSKTVRVGVQSVYSDWRFTTCIINLPLTTEQIPLPSNVTLTATADDKTIPDRKIRIVASFSNPESYYTGMLYHNGVLIASSSDPITKEINITPVMFNTKQRFSFTIKGKDDIEHITPKETEVFIEPSGLGIWYKDDEPKEVFHVYQKNNSGEIIEVTEAFCKRNNKIIKIVK